MTCVRGVSEAQAPPIKSKQTHTDRCAAEFIRQFPESVAITTPSRPVSGACVVSLPLSNTAVVMPLATDSSTTYCISGLSTNGSISFGEALVAGKNLVPSPAAGKTALRILFVILIFAKFVKSLIYKGKTFILG
jgi:hypothetical protein